MKFNPLGIFNPDKGNIVVQGTVRGNRLIPLLEVDFPNNAIIMTGNLSNVIHGLPDIELNFVFSEEAI